MAKKKKFPTEGYLYAFDLSMSCTGLVIFDITTLNPVKIMSTETNDKLEHGERLNVFREEWSKVIKEYTPTEVTIERGFSRFNTSTQVIYRVHGVCNELFSSYPQTYYPPKSVKEAILKGDASKAKVRERIEKEYPDLNFNNEDESDAFAVGLTHLIKTKRLIWKK